MANNKNILVIAAHSDDHILGAGGTIAKYSNEGKKVHVIILSYGEKSHPWLKVKVTKEMRTKETKYADKVVKCKSAFFDLKEGSFMQGYPKIKKQLTKIIKKIKPSKIFTHTNEDPHPDHSSTYKITTEIIKEAKLKPEIYLFSIWNPFSLRKSHLPKMYVNITDTYSKKIDAIKHFQSQKAALILVLWGVFTRDLKNGLHIGTKFAEGFYKLQ